MSFMDRLSKFLKREASDIGDMAESAKDRFDEELTRRETELAKSPADKIRDIQQSQLAEDAEIDRILDKAGARDAAATADAEVRDAAAGVESTEQPAPDSEPDAEVDVASPSEPASGEASDAEDVDTGAVEADAPVAKDGAADGAVPEELAEAIGDSDDVPAAADVTDQLDPVGAEGRVGDGRTAFDKTPAQLRYEEAKAAADDLLDELRGELEADGDI